MKMKGWEDLVEHERLHSLVLMCADLESAREACAVAASVPNENPNSPSDLYKCVADIIVIRYSRAFGTNEFVRFGFKSKVDASALTATFDERERSVHEMVLRMRNKITAHSDADRRIATVTTVVRGDYTHLGTSTAHAYLYDEEITTLLQMIDKINIIAAPIIVRLINDPETLARSGLNVVSRDTFDAMHPAAKEFGVF